MEKELANSYGCFQASVRYSQAFAAPYGKAATARCGAMVPQGRPKIAQRLIAGLGVGSQKVPQGRKNPRWAYRLPMSDRLAR